MMNEQLKKLKLQAIEYTNMQDTFDPCSVFAEKFAELIIRECMAMCDEVHRDYGMASDTARISKSYIKKHFGVEEK
jgi:hypothetical protein